MADWFNEFLWFWAIVFPVILVLISLITTAILTNRSIRANVHCIEDDIEELTKAVEKTIQTDGKETRNAIIEIAKAIEADGHETRLTIRNSIKKPDKNNQSQGS